MKKILPFFVNYDKITKNNAISKHFRKNGVVSVTITIHITDKEKGCRVTHMSEFRNIFDAAKYLVRLHYISEPSVACSRTKIEKLLAVADLIATKNGEALFPDYPIYINTCGIGYGVLASDPYDFPMDNIMPEPSVEVGAERSFRLTFDENKTKNIPDRYTNANVDAKTQKILRYVFCELGGYKAKQLGGFIDEFKDKIKSETPINGKFHVDRNRVKTYFLNSSGDNIVERCIVTYKGEE